jgi:sugar lactone lactonase YvrE
MLTKKLTLGLLAAGLIGGCATHSDSGMSGGSDDPGNDGDVPFTNGVSTLAGTTMAGYVDGSRAVARFANPTNVLFRDGTLYVADFDNGKLRSIDTDSHDTTTIIAQQGFQRPFGMVFAADGTLYVSTDNDQSGNHTTMSGSIWKVDLEGRKATVLANAIGRPRGLALLPDGRLAVADYIHHVIEVVDTRSGQVTPIAGTWDTNGMVDGAGSVARFSAPYNIVVRSDGNLMVTDYDNNRLRLVALDGTTSTLAGSTDAGLVDGAMATARFSHPQAMSMADNGDIYVTDTGNFVVRKISGDTIQTIAGNGKGGSVDADDPLQAEIYGLEGLSIVPDGSMLYVADGNRGDGLPYNSVRQVKLP